uniref:DEK proto-oncogene n=1 Tax=Scophthalmus maximus TaxID=52904 RepID=A0A8D3E3J5_SCOMX
MEKLKIGDGSGDKLGEIPRTSFQITKMKPADLKPLHAILFDRPGKMAMMKKNLRLFNGFPFDADSEQYNKKREKLLKNSNFTNSKLKVVCGVLDLEKKGTHSDLVDRILTFLIAPKNSGKVSAKTKKASKSKPSSSSSSPKKSKTGSKSKAIVMDSSSDEDEEDEKAGASAEAEGSDTEDKPSEKEEDQSDKSEEEDRLLLTPSCHVSYCRAADDSSDDDEPLIKMIKKSPSDEQLKETVQSLLKEADLEEMTMKQICQRVFDTFPDHDLTSKKDFIKQTVNFFQINSTVLIFSF